MVRIRIDKSRISGVLRCPPSKSYTHRAIAIASLAEGESRIKMPLIARDTLATISASTAMGVSIDRQRSGLIIKGKHILNTPSNIINAENSGTTIRIFAVMAALASTGFTILTGDASLRKRPMQPALDALGQLGVVCYSSRMNGLAPLLIKGGGIQGGSVIINGNMSSQFLSSLLISTIYAKSPVSIHVKGQQVSKPYVDSTLATMKAFGVAIDNKRDFLEYRIKNKEYKAAEFNVPADFSTAAMILAAGVLAGGSITIRGLNFLLPQADSKILDILNDMDAQVCVNRTRGEVKVTGSSLLEGGSFDLTDSPDLLPVLSILALKARSPVEISGIAHARLKETDRVSNIASQLKKFGATVIEQQDQLLIIAPKVPRNSRIQTFNDHRLFMAFTIASLLTEKTEVEGAESIDVSYPGFLQDLAQLGAKISFL
ncbi:MAG: 3-phosphoshikimate 1-carboxyvinyltransferase [Nitrososphaeraceae archaeon]|nr:3-phosphoshikimate 1-carboxyvinyltransferase [Nitrososphaeraceae archaeon]MDW0331423.1 3-phosphoshikimate 1-carboxyvinyltransferase [Nitrososphaeraceae archaeon]